MQLPQAPDPAMVRDPRAVAADLFDAVASAVRGAPDTVRLALVALLSGGHLLVEGMPGHRQDAAREVDGGRDRRPLRPGAVHARPASRPTSPAPRCTARPPASGTSGPGPVFANVVARRRGEPRVAPHPGRAARADGRAPGHRRRRDAPAARSVLRRRDPEPVRQRGHVPVAREPARPVRARRARSGCPGRVAEREILDGEGGVDALDVLSPVTFPAELAATIAAVRGVHCAHTVRDYVLDVADATRNHPGVALGASPRASLGLLRAAQAHATVMGRDFVSPDDVKQVAPAVLAHRIVLAHGVDVRGGLARRRPRSSARSSRPGREPDRRSEPHVSGPGELTLTSIVLVHARGVRDRGAGAASGEQTVVAVGVFAFVVVRGRDRLADRGAVRCRGRRRGRRPTRPSASVTTCTCELYGRVDAGRGARARPARAVVGHRGAGRGCDPAPREPPRRVPRGARRAAHVGAARRVRAHARRARRAARRARGRAAPGRRGAVAATSVPDDGVARRVAVRRRARRGRHGPAVRPYVAGDPARLVHWPTSARPRHARRARARAAGGARRRARRRPERRPRRASSASRAARPASAARRSPRAVSSGAARARRAARCRRGRRRPRPRPPPGARDRGYARRAAAGLARGDVARVVAPAPSRAPVRTRCEAWPLVGHRGP